MKRHFCQVVYDAGWRACELCTSMWSSAILTETLLTLDGAATWHSDLWLRVMSVEFVPTNNTSSKKYHQQAQVSAIKSPWWRCYCQSQGKVPGFATHIVTILKAQSSLRMIADRMNADSRIISQKQFYLLSEPIRHRSYNHSIGKARFD